MVQTRIPSITEEMEFSKSYAFRILEERGTLAPLAVVCWHDGNEAKRLPVAFFFRNEQEKYEFAFRLKGAVKKTHAD